MSQYQGYLLKFGGTVMPNRYFMEYSSTPAQISDDDAGTDQTGMLWRSPLPHKRSSIRFSTHMLHLEDKLAFQSIINLSIVNNAEDKVYVEYWNDRINDYSAGYFYLPSIEYSIADAGDDDLLYNPITVELVEY